MSKSGISRAVSIVVIIIIIGAGLAGYSVGLTNQSTRVTTSTMSRTATSISTMTQIQFQTTTETLTFTEEPSTNYATVAPSGLQLQITLNTTTIPAGGALVAQVDLINTLNQNLSLTPNWSADTNISDWDYYDYLCGLSAVYHTFSFALYRGYYTQGNLSDAGSRCLLFLLLRHFAPLHHMFNHLFRPLSLPRIATWPPSPQTPRSPTSSNHLQLTWKTTLSREAPPPRIMQLLRLSQAMEQSTQLQLRKPPLDVVRALRSTATGRHPQTVRVPRCTMQTAAARVYRRATFDPSPQVHTQSLRKISGTKPYLHTFKSLRCKLRSRFFP